MHYSWVIYNQVINITAVFMSASLTVLPDRSMAFFTRPYVPFPRVCRNSYRCLRLCLWWCLFTAWRLAGAAPDPSPSISFTRAQISRNDVFSCRVQVRQWAARDDHPHWLESSRVWAGRCSVGVSLTVSTALSIVNRQVGVFSILHSAHDDTPLCVCALHIMSTRWR